MSLLLQVITIFVVFCSGLSAGNKNEDYLQEFERNLHIGVDKLFRRGIVGDELKNSLGALDLNQFLFFDYERTERFDPQLICTGCEIVIDAAISSKRNGTGDHELAGYIVDACANLQIQPREICQKLIDLNFPIFAYVIDNMPELKGSRVCSIIFQEFQCKSDEGSAEWAINIHEGTGAEGTPGSGVSKKILHVTDVHYDPDYVVGSLAKCTRPLCCQKDSGVVENPEDGAGYWADYNKCDTPKHTLVNSLNQMAREHKDVEYVYFTGDIMNHKVWASSIEYNTQSMVTALEAFKEAFGDTPVFPIFGNHEPHPLNVWIPENDKHEMSTQWIFDLVADLWGKWLPKSAKETIKKGGYYTVLVEPGFRVIAINSNVAYTYNWWLILDEVDPFGQLAWMEGVLYGAEQNGESVHILSHVPSGEAYIPWAAQFGRIVRRYSGTITGIFNGHTHYDEFTLYEDGRNEPAEVAWNGGSLTPFTNNNPNYRVFHVDDGNYEIIDYDEYIFNVTEANMSPDSDPIWYKLYSFKEAYGVESMQARDVYDLAVRMAKETDKTLLQQYYRYKSREGLSAEKECNDNCLKKLLCRALTSLQFDTTTCDRVMENWS